jgi:hypothetical protein
MKPTLEEIIEALAELTCEELTDLREAINAIMFERRAAPYRNAPEDTP